MELKKRMAASAKAHGLVINGYNERYDRWEMTEGGLYRWDGETFRLDDPRDAEDDACGGFDDLFPPRPTGY